MTASQRYRALAAIDLRSIGRDELLRWIVLVPLALAVVVRYGVPALGLELERRFAFDLAPYHPLILSFLALMVPQFLGLVTGFLLLDQRDDRTLTALQVTPLRPLELLGFRLLVPMLLSLLVTLAVFAIAGVLPFSPAASAASALSAAAFAPCYALLLACFAHNKVQGFAIAKGAGILVMPPIAAWFVAEPWQFLFGLVPSYWPMKAYWSLQAGDPVGYLHAGAGIVAFSLALIPLLRRLDRVLHR